MGGMNRQSTETFRALKLHVWNYNDRTASFIIHLSKYLKCTISGVHHKKNYCLWVTVMLRCSFIGCNTYTTLVRDVGNGEAVHVLGWGLYGKSLYLLLNFAVNLKLFKRIKRFPKGEFKYSLIHFINQNSPDTKTGEENHHKKE